LGLGLALELHFSAPVPANEVECCKDVLTELQLLVVYMHVARTDKRVDQQTDRQTDKRRWR